MAALYALRTEGRFNVMVSVAPSRRDEHRRSVLGGRGRSGKPTSQARKAGPDCSVE